MSAANWQYQPYGDAVPNANRFMNPYEKHTPYQKSSGRMYFNKTGSKKVIDKPKTFVHPSMVEDPWQHLTNRMH